MEQETFERNIREYAPNMYRLALAMLHNRQDAEDAVSEAVLIAYEKRHTLRDRNRFKPWIMQIMANEARRIYGKNRRITPMEDMEAYMPSFRDENHELWDVVMQLETAHREVIMLYFYERFSIKEIGRILHVPEGTVKSRLYRAKKALKEMLEE
ncbi:MAG: sigma-70 family RNA polymerase sigma factor [Lachnospiraceae bacterium]|nr:sigma-70 family RNA polymerase sigma factor [Lachnospiraceae bacterium]MBD5506075.1 sigma-70 family RNA polymerase sigma factor [Lachnospiraceae bacterium]